VDGGMAPDSHENAKKSESICLRGRKDRGGRSLLNATRLAVKEERPFVHLLGTSTPVRGGGSALHMRRKRSSKKRVHRRRGGKIVSCHELQNEEGPSQVGDLSKVRLQT